MEVPRWTVNELMTRYELEPSLTDVFVEGQYDKDILTCAYEHSATERRALYTSDVLDVEAGLFEKHRLSNGNKQKLIILWRELSGVNTSGNVRFIVDRDVDHWVGALETNNGLVWTDFCDMESYFFEENFVKELVQTAGRAKISSWGDYYGSFCETLKMLFSLRIADRSLGLSLSFMDFGRLLTVKSGKIYFDFETYVERTLNKSNLAARRAETMKESLEWCKKLSGDQRLFCRGHDFVFLISWSILKFKGIKDFSDEAIARTLILLVPRDANRFASLL